MMQFWLLIFLLLFALPALAEDGLNVAVASSYAREVEPIIRQYETENGITVNIISGSTGKLYEQIIHGAPFDLFLAADESHPRLLVEAGKAMEPVQYATGEVVLWSPALEGSAADILMQAKHIAIANPKTAPYGASAKAWLEQAELWEAVTSKLVYGESVAQAFHFAKTGAAEVAFVPQFFVQDEGHWQSISAAPVVQMGVVLTGRNQQAQATALLKRIAEAR